MMKIIVVFLAIGSLVRPLPLWAEDAVSVASSTDVLTADENAAVQVAALSLSASITTPANNANIQVGVATTFTASATAGEPPYAYTWDFGDGTTAFGQSYSKTYTTPGAKTVVLTITDFAGHTANATITVVISTPVSPLLASITAPSNNSQIQTGAATTFTASADGGEPPYAYTWDFGDGTTAFGQNYTKTYTSAGARTVTVTVTDFAGAPATARVNLTITASPPPPPPPPAEPLTISNIRVTDITHNSAIVRWTTNRPATSRVIYDTVSHPNLAGQSAPNFGYGFSTGTLDAEPKVTEHIVTVSGLTPDSTYYFRVISQ